MTSQRELAKQRNRQRRAERIQLDMLREAVNAARSTLRKDEFGDWALVGGNGLIKIVDGIYHISLMPVTERRWKNTEHKLVVGIGAKLSDIEPRMLTLSQIPEKHRGEMLREAVRLRKGSGNRTNLFGKVEKEGFLTTRGEAANG